MGPKNTETITVSIVLYKNRTDHIDQLCKSLLLARISLDIYFVDNSPTKELEKQIVTNTNSHYSWTGKNIGFGQGHNSVIEEHLDSGKFHLVLNPDVYYPEGTIERIASYMNEHEDIGLLLPRVLNPDKSEQPLYKLLPKPQDLFFRRFMPALVKKGVKNQLLTYNMSFADQSETFDAPYLSGCFMFIRKQALKEVGVFDSRFFLYCEDIDLSRRIHTKWRTTYFADAYIYHHFYKGSYKEPRLLYHHIISAVKYFNKHGWLRDQERDQFNKETLDNFEVIIREPVLLATK
ncbi:MAG: GT2 family glycosyltransferase [Roseivirga sp.]|jgi:GT2 family glycosyltransferase